MGAGNIEAEAGAADLLALQGLRRCPGDQKAKRCQRYDDAMHGTDHPLVIGAIMVVLF
jgi:hypothetical protein